MSKFWDNARKASEEVRKWPKWMRDGSMIQRPPRDTGGVDREVVK